MNIVQDIRASASNSKPPLTPAELAALPAALRDNYTAAAGVTDDEARAAFRAASRAEGPAAKRLTGRHQSIAQHYKMLLARTLSALGAPDITARDFLSSVVVAVGWDPPAGVQLYDAAIADANIGPFPKAQREEREAAVNRRMDRLAQQRKRIIQWQGIEGNPPLFDYDGKYDHDLGARRCKYHFHILELVREIAADVTPYAAPARIDGAISRHVHGYLERWTGSARRTSRKREQTPESDLHRAATLVQRAIDKALRRGDDEDRAADLIVSEFFDRLTDKKYAKFVHFENANPLKTEIVNPDEVLTTVRTPPASIPIDPPGESGRAEEENCLSHTINNQALFAPQPMNPREITIHDTAEPADIHDSGARALGMPVEDFIARTWGDRPIDYRLPISTDFLSLTELESFDRRAPHGGGERRFCCPLCGGSKPMDAAHRCLSVDMTSGAYFCHRCETKGKLREWFTDAPTIPARSFAPVAPMAAKATPETWRKWLAAAAPIEAPKATQGADYLTGRGIPTGTAAAAGVLFGRWYHDAQPFEGVIFPLHNGTGKLSAAQARAIAGATKNSRGPIKDSVFVATPGALDAPDLAITEAPIDALALAATGQPAIALCGKSWPDWLIERLQGRRVLIAFDADAAGDEAAAELLAALDGIASAERLRPRGAKDWGELAQSYGLGAIDAQFVM